MTDTREKGAAPNAAAAGPAPVLFSGAEAAKALGAALPGSGAGREIREVRIDSRTAGPDSLFVALRGERTDGHNFIADAASRGCRAFLVSSEGARSRAEEYARIAAESGSLFIEVESPLAGLQALAARHLDGFPRLLRIGITGSSGKTTTKEMVAAILSRSMSVVMNEGNLNSETGLPLSVFSVRAEHRAGVFEMGMNRVGEIDELAGVLRPSLALVTNVGTAHIGILGSKDAIAEEKKKVFSRFSGPETGFIDEDEPYLGFLAEGMRGELVTYGPRTTPGFRGSASLGLDGTAVDWEGSRFALPLPGSHNLRNALGAVSLALRAGCAAADVAEGLSSLKPLFGRGEVVRGRATVVRDCYNANPESARAAIDFCDSVDWKGRRIYVIGSMLELGASSEAEHAELGGALARSRADAVILYGAETEAALDAMREAGYRGTLAMCREPAEVLKQLGFLVAEGDLVLLKGSRGMRMEEFAEAASLGAGGGAC